VRAVLGAAFACVLVGVSAVAASADATPTTTPPPTTSPETETTSTVPGPPASTVPKPAARPVRAVVDLSEQHAYFYDRKGILVRKVPVSTGATGTRTRQGSFKVYSRSARTFSRATPAVKMRYMTRFDGGIGFHGIPYRVRGGVEVPLATPLGERPVSHGCVRMRNRDARWVFRTLPDGARVVVQP